MAVVTVSVPKSNVAPGGSEMRFWPRNLLGQTLIVVAIALLAAQLISAVLLVRSVENRRMAVAVNVTANLHAFDAPRIEASQATRDKRRLRRGPGRGRMPIEVRDTPPEFSMSGTGNSRIETGIVEQLGEYGSAPFAVHATIRKVGNDAFLRERYGAASRRRNPDWPNRELLVTAIQSEEDGRWLVTRVPLPRSERGVLGGIILQTGLLFFLLIGVLYLLLRRITQPLAKLSQRVDHFARTQSAAEPLEPSGPQDVADLITAHNALEARIASMLDEKDVMLGAIGHDLKTPLAALRVRIESIEDSANRTKMAASIEEISQSLDDILSLARIGRSNVPPEPIEISALVQSVVEEFEDLGQPVELTNSQRVVAQVHLHWLKRALRNLISNAVRYGGNAQVSLEVEASSIALVVEDNGPGISPDQIDAMLEPFRRGEGSRNRVTGGAGLGLTLARAIAEQHSGTLTISNRESGGLRAEIRLPLDGARKSK